jgi:hypothetical protein
MGTVLALCLIRGCAKQVLAQRLARRTFKPGKGAPGRLGLRPLHSSPLHPPFSSRKTVSAAPLLEQRKTIHPQTSVRPVVSPGKNKVPLHPIQPAKRLF